MWRIFWRWDVWRRWKRRNIQRNGFFMLVGLKINTHFIINCVSEREVNGYFVMNNLKECLHELDFNNRGFVSDNHSSNVSAYMKLFSHYGINSSDLHITFNSKRIYLFYNSVHLMKSIRNKLHNHKRLLFPPYDFEEFNDGICVPAGEIKWQIFCHNHEEDKKLDAHLRAAPKIIASVIPLEVVRRVSLRPHQYLTQQPLLLWKDTSLIM